MPVPLRRKFAGPDGAPGPDPACKRVHRQDLPAEATVLVLPYVGTTWRTRGAEYWISRGMAVVALAVPGAAIAGLDFLILWGEYRRGGYGSSVFWATIAVMVAAAGWSAAAALAMGEFPLARVRRTPVGALAHGLLVLVFLVGTPGAWLAALGDQLRVRPSAERLAREDLERQLSDRAAGREAATGAGAGAASPSNRRPEKTAIESVPLLGTTWYARGPAYWVRRFMILVLWLFALAMLTAVVGGLAAGASNGRRDGAFWTMIAVEAVLTMATVVYCFVAQSRSQNRSGSLSPTTRVSALIRASRIQQVTVLILIALVVLFCIGAIAKIHLLTVLAVAPLALLWLVGYGGAIFAFLQMCRPRLTWEPAARAPALPSADQ